MCQQKHRFITTIQVTTNGGNLRLPDVAEIRDGNIRSIWLRRAAGGTLITRMGDTVAADTVIATAHLTLVNQKMVQVAIIPLQSLQRDFNSPEPLATDENVYAGVDLSRSSIVLDTNAAGYSATAVIEIMFEYDC